MEYVTNHELKDEINKLYDPVLCFDALQRKFGKHGYSLKFGLQQRENNKQSVIIVNFPDGGCKMVYEVTKHNDVNHILACPRIYYRGPYKFTEIASPDLEVLIIGWNCYTMVGILIKARLLSWWFHNCNVLCGYFLLCILCDWWWDYNYMVYTSKSTDSNSIFYTMENYYLRIHSIILQQFWYTRRAWWNWLYNLLVG